MNYLDLFLSFIQVGALSIGGGYAAIPIIKNQIVDIHHWLSLSEFTNLVTIAETTPGPITINSATFVGNRIGGFLGAVIATVGSIIPSLIIVTIIAKLYFKYRNISFLSNILERIRPAILALILAAFLNIFFDAINIVNFEFLNINILNVIFFILVIILLRKTKLSPILIMLSTGFLAVIISFI